MKKSDFSILLFLFYLLCSSQVFSFNKNFIQPNSVDTSLTQYVNTLAGTTNNGNTIPAVGLPFGMTQWTPQTRPTERKCQTPYYYQDPEFSGFRATHWLSGSCTQDYGSVTIMPITGKLSTDINDYQCPLDHSKEIAKPYYYGYDLSKYNVYADVTATLRCGILRFKSNRSDSLYLLITPNSDKNKAFIKIDSKHHEIVGYNPAYRVYQGAGQPAGISGYFVILFQQDFSTVGTFSEQNISTSTTIKNQKNEGAFVGFKVTKGSSLIIKVGTSFTSIEAARKNLDAEIPDWDFDDVKNEAKATWEKKLKKIQVTGGTNKEKRIFYTSLYHTMQQPRLFNDIDGSYPKFSQQYKTGKLLKGNYYDDFSIWDIYRAEIPLYEILSPMEVNDWVRSLIIKGEEGGWLPIFPCWNNYTAEMIGDHAVDIIASAYLKGIRDYDIKEAYRVMRKNALDTPDTADYINGKGRRALTSYKKYGYVPMDDKVPYAYHSNEQTSRTLEYAYDDYGLALMAKALHKKEDYQAFINRAKNYRNVFDKEKGLMNGRYIDGSWYKPFFPDKGMVFATESTPRQATFYVPQDVPGLAKLMGGRDRLELALDSLFMKHNYDHGNEPDQQAPYMYNYTPHPYKTQYQVSKILATEYNDGPGGLSGNDDAGEISAWYILAAMGFYPVNTVSGAYLISAPIFDTVKISSENNRRFTIITHKESPQSIYIYKTTFNGRTYDKNYLTYKMIKQGRFEIFLQDKPSTWGSDIKNQPEGL